MAFRSALKAGGRPVVTLRAEPWLSQEPLKSLVKPHLKPNIINIIGRCVLGFWGWVCFGLWGRDGMGRRVVGNDAMLSEAGSRLRRRETK
ncbi:hypothetical protein SH449x_001790 [Pirellulaceae bacterium SH449]